MLVPDFLVLRRGPRALLLAPMATSSSRCRPTSTAGSPPGSRTNGRRWTPTACISGASGCGPASSPRSRSTRRSPGREGQRPVAATSTGGAAATTNSNARRTSSGPVVKPCSREPAVRGPDDAAEPPDLLACREVERRERLEADERQKRGPLALCGFGVRCERPDDRDEVLGDGEPSHRPRRAGPGLVDGTSHQATDDAEARASFSDGCDRPARRRRLGLEPHDERLGGRNRTESSTAIRTPEPGREVLDHDRQPAGGRRGDGLGQRQRRRRAHHQAPDAGDGRGPRPCRDHVRVRTSHADDDRRRAGTSTTVVTRATARPRSARPPRP